MTVANPYSAPTAVGTVAGDETYTPNVFSFHGRIGRLRYLAYSLVYSLVMYAVILAGGLVGGALSFISESLAYLGVVFVFVAMIGSVVGAFALAIRRFNDLNQSGWLCLLMFVPLVNFIVILFLLFAPGANSENNYGPAPSGNSTAVIIGACFLPLIFICVIGILAAIAIPAYNEYAMRAEAASEFQIPE